MGLAFGLVLGFILGMAVMCAWKYVMISRGKSRVLKVIKSDFGISSILTYCVLPLLASFTVRL